MAEGPVRFRPLTSADYTKKQCVTMQSGITTHLGGTSKNSNMINLSDEVHTSYIELCTPVVNEILGGSHAEHIGNFLGIGKDIKKFYDLSWGIDLTNYEIVTDLPDTAHCQQYLLGGKAIKYLIENFDHEKAIINWIQGLIKPIKLDDATFVTNDKIADTDILLFADYYLHFANDIVRTSFLKKESNIRSKINAEFSKVINRPAMLLNTPVNYLVSVGDHNSNLSIRSRVLGRYPAIMNMLTQSVVVIPVAMRPSLDQNARKADPLSNLYIQVLNASTTLQSMSNAQTTTISEYRDGYMRLQNAVTALLCNNPDEKAHPEAKSLLSKTKTKHGQVRTYNLGKRQDYSGRAVVTIAPYLSLDMIRIPESMIPDLYEWHILPILKDRLEAANAGDTNYSHLFGKTLEDIKDPIVQKEMLNIVQDYDMLRNIPVYMGRQPTLHKLSIQGFRSEPTKSSSIEVNPLVCPAFNMDFDGDAAHIEVPLSSKAITEVSNLVLTTNNIFLPKDGESTIEPRQDMLYGLYICTKDTNLTETRSRDVGVFSSCEDVKQKLFTNKIKVWDKVSVNGMQCTVGDAAFMSCFKEGDIAPRGTAGTTAVKEITSKTIGEFMEHILRKNGDKYVYSTGNGSIEEECKEDTFVGCINRLVELGFKIARLYPPSIPLIDSVSKGSDEYENAIDTLTKNTAESDFAYAIGLETTEAHKAIFTDALSKTQETVNSGITNVLSDNNGYKLMALSGARGKVDNLYQIFKFKGQIKKDENTSFDAVVENCYMSQLTPFEHFICAYGGRQGQMDKSLKTGDTGYAARRLWHATHGYTITEDDCGTTEGVPVDFNFLNKMYPDIDTPSLMRKYLEGHYEILPNGKTGDLITHEKALEYTSTEIGPDGKPQIQKVHWVRTPMTCKNPCCVKCYGIDWSTRELAIVGLNVGIIAAHSIGEPATQLVMKQFQKGGVANASDVSSAFDKVNAYLNVKKLTKDHSGYDPAAWADGEIITSTSPTGMNIRINNSKKNISVSRSITVKEFAEKGYGMSLHTGDLDVNELREYMGIRWAQRYLVGKLYAIYADQADIRLIHFETLVAALTRYVVISTDRTDIMHAQCCTAQELFADKESAVYEQVGVNKYRVINSNYVTVTPSQPELIVTLDEVLSNSTYTIVRPIIVKVSDAFQRTNDALDNIDMEDIGLGLARINMFQMSDKFTKPINRMLLAKSITTGSETPGFTTRRSQQR